MTMRRCLPCFMKRAFLLMTLPIWINSFNPDDLINGKTDAMVSYLTDQVDYFKKKGIEINIIDPRNYGVDFLSDNLFTTEQEINQHPERVRAFSARLAQRLGLCAQTSGRTDPDHSQ